MKKPAVKIKSVLSVVDDLEARADKLIQLAKSLRKEYHGVDSLEVEEEFREVQAEAQHDAFGLPTTPMPKKPKRVAWNKGLRRKKTVNPGIERWKNVKTYGKTLTAAVLDIMPVGRQLRAADVKELLERDGFKGVSVQSVMAELSKRHLQGKLERPDKGVYMKVEDK